MLLTWSVLTYKLYIKAQVTTTQNSIKLLLFKEFWANRKRLHKSFFIFMNPKFGKDNGWKNGSVVFAERFCKMALLSCSTKLTLWRDLSAR